MIKRLTRPIIFLYVTVFTALVLILTLFTYFFSQNQKNWLTMLISTQLFHIPFIIYVLLIAITVGFIMTISIYFIRRSVYSRLEEKMRLLASGNLESPLLQRSIHYAEDDEFIPDIDRDFEIIRNKLLEMSKGLQAISSQPQLVDGQSKEEILEGERHRLARELHDSVSQQLFAAMMLLSALNEQTETNDTPESFRKQLKMIEDIINTSQSEMRALLLHLRPTTLEGKSLKKGIEQLLVELQNKIQIDLLWEIADIHLPNGIEDHLFRIVQELLSNTLRHAKAKELEVYLSKVSQNVLLRMVDDGVGFDMDDKKMGSYGLKNIRERVASMGGSCKIISFDGQGTSVEIKIPIIKEDERID